MDNPFIRKLEQFTPLSVGDKSVLAALSRERVKAVAPRDDIIREGDRPNNLYVILAGWGCRYKTLEDGRRQIVAFLLPGDMCDLNIFLLRQMDHSIRALTPVTCAEIDPDALTALTLEYPRIARALWWDTLMTAAIQREWNVSLGQRTASERLAHLFCELFFRLRAVGLADGNTCELPLTQADLGDASGLSAVHVNRTLQELRAANLIGLRGKTLTIPNLQALESSALFNSNYLHFGREGSRFDANEP